jgi:hypothetical protein
MPRGSLKVAKNKVPIGSGFPVRLPIWFTYRVP